MSRGRPAIVNPDMLVWAREERGFTVEQAARSIGLTPEKLRASEFGAQRLTFAELKRAAWVYRRPTAAFFLSKKPMSLSIPEFRRGVEHSNEPLSPELRLEIRRIYQKREAATEFAEFGPSFDWQLVGSATLDSDPERLGQHIRDVFSLSDRFPIGLSPHRAFDHWRESVEKSGVLVFQITQVDLEEMRGFSVGAKPFPAIAVNRKDAPGPRSFTLLHELCHVMIADSSMCEIRDEKMIAEERAKSIEVFCNHAAGAALVPARVLLATAEVRRHGREESWTDLDLQQLASRFKVSREVILLRLLFLGRTTDGFYRSKRQDWQQQAPVSKHEPWGEPIHEMVLRTEGRIFTSMVVQAFHGDALDSTDVSELLGMDLKHLSSLERLLEERV